MNKSTEKISAMSQFFREALDEPDLHEAELIETLLELQKTGKYDEGSELGEGGMKRVYLRQDLMTERPVALAELRQQKKDNVSISEFIREARITAAVAHPNIVPVYEIGINENSEPFYTMKYIQGEDLGKILAKLKSGDAETLKKFTLNRLLIIYLKLCEAVAFAHSRGVVHLDLKPDNVLVGPYGQVQLCDWGLAQYLNDISEGVEEKLMGTVGFIAPERIEGKAISKAADVFSLGSILYQILTYEVPFIGEDLKQSLQNTLCARLQDMKSVSPKNRLPRALQAISNKAMAHKQEDRYSSVDELILDLEAYQADLPTRAGNPGLIQRSTLWVKRHKSMTISTLMGLLIFLIISDFYRMQVRRETERRKQISKKAIPHYNEKAREAFESFDFGEAMKNVEKSLSYQESPEAHRLKGQLHFLRNEWDLAIYHLERSKDSKERLIKLIEEIKTLPKMSQDDFFFTKVTRLNEQHYPGIIIKLFWLRNQEVSDLNKHLDFLHRALKSLNVRMVNYDLRVVEGKIHFKAESYLTRLSPFSNLPINELHLSNSPLRSLESLRGLKKIDYLNISGSQVSDFSPLFGMEIDYLDISETLINSLNNLDKIKLKRLKMKGLRVLKLSALDEHPSLEKVELDAQYFTTDHDKRRIKQLQSRGLLD